MEQIQVISKQAIPPIQRIDQEGQIHELGELRDFRWNDVLRSFMPEPSRFSVSWVQLQDGEVLQPHVHPIQSMLICYKGSGRMLGDSPRPVNEEDVIVIPPGARHGFVGGPAGLYALSIQFGEGLYTEPDKPRVMFGESEHSLEALLEFNRRRIEEFKQRPIFELLADGTLNDPAKREIYQRTLQIWVDGNQTLLFTRQATCADPRFASMFIQHMREEMGHDELHRQAERGAPEQERFKDPVMEAITNWFAYQMYLLDNVEKTAIIHLVIENASEAYHRAAMPVLSKHVDNDYFELHVENDSEHAAMGIALLGDETPATYARLMEVVGEAWDMIGAMTDRLVERTRATASGNELANEASGAQT